MDFATMMALEPHGTDVWVGAGPRYPWGGLYGGQIVAQALRAGTFTVEDRYGCTRCWHVQTYVCDGIMSSRGVSLGHVFTGDGTHVATVSQEVLLRPKRR